MLATNRIRWQMQWSRGSPVVVVKPSEHALGDDGFCDVDSDRWLPRNMLGDKPTKMLAFAACLGFLVRLRSDHGAQMHAAEDLIDEDGSVEPDRHPRGDEDLRPEAGGDVEAMDVGTREEE